MSVGNNSTGIDYNDHDVQAVEATTSMRPADLDGAIAQKSVTYSIDPLDGLDREELAELVYYKFYFNLTARAAGNSPQKNGDQAYCLSDAFWGINLDSDGTATELIDGQAIEDEIVVETNTQEALSPAGKTGINNGLLDHANMVSYSPVDESDIDIDVRSSGGALQGPNVIEQNFREIYGSGPVLDRFDDFTIVHKVQSENALHDVKSEIRGFLVFNTSERENMVGSNF